MNLNLRAKSKNKYDAIVIRSGISGGWAAKELCEKGLKVLLLDRGKNVAHPNDYKTAHLDPWDFPHRGRLTVKDKETHHIQNRHYACTEDIKHWFINDKENPYTEHQRFDWIRLDVVGGRSLIWGRQCYRWSDLDFEANLRDGISIDWPIRYKDLSPWYDYVESFIGVSGQAENIPHLPDGKFLPPMEMNCAEKYFKSKVEAAFPGRKVIMGRTANLTQPVKGRGQCQYRNLCSRGCPYGAYFSTNASTLPSAFATGNLTLLPHTLVNKVIYDDVKRRASGVEVIDAETNQTSEYYADLIFINASTLGSAFILLNSVSSRFPNGLGNDGDQVGRNLMDHHKCNGLSAEVEGFKDQYYFGKRANGIYIPRFRNIQEKRSDYIRGFNYQGRADRSGLNGLTGSFELGESLKNAAETPGPWNISFTGFGECLPHEDNRVTLNKEKQDKWGRPTLAVACEFRENEKMMQKDMISSIGEMMESAGFKNLKLQGTVSYPGNSNHEMGVARMGHDPKTSVLNGYNQMHAVPNVFIESRKTTCLAGGNVLTAMP